MWDFCVIALLQIGHAKALDLHCVILLQPSHWLLRSSLKLRSWHITALISYSKLFTYFVWWWCGAAAWLNDSSQFEQEKNSTWAVHICCNVWCPLWFCLDGVRSHRYQLLRWSSFCQCWLVKNYKEENTGSFYLNIFHISAAFSRYEHTVTDNITKGRCKKSLKVWSLTILWRTTTPQVWSP